MTNVKLLVLHSTTWNHLTVCQKIKMGSDGFKKMLSIKCVHESYVFKIIYELHINTDVISWRDKLHSVRITSIHSILRRSYIVVICKNKSYITFVIDPPLMMAPSRAESTRDTYNYGQYINQFPPNTIKVIREYERIQKKICRQKMSIMFNKICINEEMLPKYIYFKIIYIYIYICVCVCV